MPSLNAGRGEDRLVSANGVGQEVNRFLERDQLLFWERAKQWNHVGLIPQELSVMSRSEKRMRRLASTARARQERGE